MIIDQLFENNNKKLNEEHGEDCDLCNGSGEGMFDGESCHKCNGTGELHGERDEDDFDIPDDYDDYGDEESYYEKSLRSRGLGEQGVAESQRLNKLFRDYRDSPEADMTVGSPKIVYKGGKAVGEIGLDHDPSPGQGPYYMKHYETNTWYSGYDTKQEALADLKHVVAQMNEQGVAEGFSDIVKGVKRAVKGKEHPDVVASKHLGRALGHYHQGSLPDAEKETKRYNKVQSMNKGIKTLPYPMKEQGVAEGRRNKQRKLDEAVLLEDPLYRKFKGVGRYIAERKMSEKEILDVFQQAEAGMTNKGTGANRTMLGRGKDATTKFAGDVSSAVKGVLSSIQNSVPVAAVDVAYDQATDALANVAGGQSGPVMNAIKKYRNLAKQYPKTAGFAKAALVAIAGLATGGAGLPAIAGLTYALDSAIKGDKLSSVLGKGVGAAALSAAGQAVHGAMSPDAASPQPGDADFQLPADSVASNAQVDLDAAREWINGDEATRAEIEQITGMSPAQLQDIAVSNDLISNADSLAPGEEIVSPDGAATGAEGLPGQFAGGQYEVAKGDQLGYIAQANGVSAEDIKALNPQINWAKPLQPGMTLNLPPTGDGAGSVWGGYTGGVYGDKAAAAAGQAASNAGPTAGSTTSDVASNTATGATRSLAGPNDAADADQFYNPTTSDMSPEQIAASQAYTDAVNAPAPAGYQKGIAYDDEGNLLPGWNAQAIGGKPYNVFRESVKIKKLPVDKLIDQKTTVLSWALSESVGRKSMSVNLTTAGTYTVFENVDRYRKAILEYTQPGRPQLPDMYRPDMPGAPVTPEPNPGIVGRGLNWLDKAAGKVGGALSNFGHQFTTGVTKEKLKMNWHQAGKPTDSDQLAAWLVKQGVPQDVVSSVYSGMSIPYTATAQPAAAPAAGGAQKSMPFYGTNPATKKPWTHDELQAKAQAGTAAPVAAAADAAATQPTATTAAAATFPGEDPTGPNYVGRREVARRQAARGATATPAAAAPNFAQQGGGYKSVNYAPNIKTGVNLPKPAAAPAAAPATAAASAGPKVVSGGPTPDEQAKLAQRIAQATKQPVAEMLAMVETKEDVRRIKDFIDQTFVKHGAVSESAFVVRNKLIEHVTQVGAQRRREFARKS